jgi:hypothetical protein
MRIGRLRYLLATTAVLLLGGTTSFAAPMTYTFSTDPSSGSIQGTPGSTIGWGYSITNNDSTDWLVTVNLTSNPFADGVPDASIFDFPIIAPGATAFLPYDPIVGTGLFALTWSSSAPIGFTNSGVFTLNAEWWTGDPFAGGTFIQDAVEETATYLATVSRPNAVPEPNGFLLLATALLALLIVHKRVRAT